MNLLKRVASILFAMVIFLVTAPITVNAADNDSFVVATTDMVLTYEGRMLLSAIFVAGGITFNDFDSVGGITGPFVGHLQEQQSEIINHLNTLASNSAPGMINAAGNAIGASRVPRWLLEEIWEEIQIFYEPHLNRQHMRIEIENTLVARPALLPRIGTYQGLPVFCVMHYTQDWGMWHGGGTILISGTDLNHEFDIMRYTLGPIDDPDSWYTAQFDGYHWRANMHYFPSVMREWRVYRNGIFFQASARQNPDFGLISDLGFAIVRFENRNVGHGPYRIYFVHMTSIIMHGTGARSLVFTRLPNDWGSVRAVNINDITLLPHMIPYHLGHLANANIMTSHGAKLLLLRDHMRLGNFNHIYISARHGASFLVGATVYDVVVADLLPSVVEGFLDRILGAVTRLPQQIASAVVGNPDNLDFSALEGYGNLPSVFPFSIPWDLVNGFSAMFGDDLSQRPPPTFEIDLSDTVLNANRGVVTYSYDGYPDNGLTMEFELEQFETVAVIVRWFIMGSFIIGLIMVTSRIIKW